MKSKNKDATFRYTNGIQLHRYVECERCGSIFSAYNAKAKRCMICRRYRNCKICGKEFSLDNEIGLKVYCSKVCQYKGSLNAQMKFRENEKEKKNQHVKKKPEADLNRDLREMHAAGFGCDYGAYMAAKAAIK